MRTTLLTLSTLLSLAVKSQTYIFSQQYPDPFAVSKGMEAIYEGQIMAFNSEESRLVTTFPLPKNGTVYECLVSYKSAMEVYVSVWPSGDIGYEIATLPPANEWRSEPFRYDMQGIDHIQFSTGYSPLSSWLTIGELRIEVVSNPTAPVKWIPVYEDGTVRGWKEGRR